jgi:hypothetical protein
MGLREPEGRGEVGWMGGFSALEPRMERGVRFSSGELVDPEFRMVGVTAAR